MVKPKTKAEKDWMNKVAQLGCLICENNYVVLHHVTTLKRGFGTRSSHFHVLPLCVNHHDAGIRGVSLHASIPEWENKHGTQIELLKKVYNYFDKEIDF